MKGVISKKWLVTLVLVGVIACFALTSARAKGTGYPIGPILPDDLQISPANDALNYADVAFDGNEFSTVCWMPYIAASQPGGLAVQVDNATVTVDEGQTAENTGSLFEPGLDDVTISASVGAVTLQSGPGGDLGVFLDSGQNLGGSDSRGIAVGDLDGDGDLDVFVVNRYAPHKVWLNDGGAFTDSGQSLSNWVTYSVALGDVDGDGDLDAFVGMVGANKVWLNDGSGVFTDSGQNLGSAGTISMGVALGDLDGDGDLDAFVVNHSGQASRVWLNNGTGTFTDSGQSLSGSDGYAAALGDVDGDNDLDAFVVNGSGQAKVWLNDGAGTFTDSAQSLGSGAKAVAFGDVDGDGDLDAFVGIYGANEVWLNDGSGVFSDSGQTLGSLASKGVALGDVDGDGDLDAFVINWLEAKTVWLNDGAGNFDDSGQALDSSSSGSVALGDADGDGYLDAFVANLNDETNKLWINQGAPVVQGWSWSFDTSDGPAESQTVTITATDSDGDSSQTTFELVVNNVAPTATFGNDGPVDEGSSFSLFLTDPFDPSTADTDAGFEYAFDCGDGGGYGVWDSSNSALCATSDDDGVRSVRGQIRDKDGGVTEYTDSVTVNNVAPAVTPPADQITDEATPTTFDLGSFADPGDDDPWLVTVNWGDDSSDAFTMLAPGALGSLNHTYADDGAYTVQVTVAEKDGNADSGNASFWVTVDNLAPTASDDTASVDEDGPVVTIAVLDNDSDPAGAADPLAVTAVDATGTAGAVSFTAGGVTYDPNGKFESLAVGETTTDGFGYSISDGDGGAASATVLVTVNGVNDAPVVTTDNATVTVDEGQTATNSGDLSDVDGSDSVTISASVGTISQDAGNGSAWSWSWDTADGPADSQTVTITADDGNGGVTITTFELIVDNVPPAVNAISVPVDPVNIAEQPVSASAAFSDPGGVNDEPYTCMVDYGDDSSPQAGVISSAECAGPDHTYAQAGVYVVTVTVTDKDGDSGSAEATKFIVIYDTDGGFVTGGGWIYSEAGWCQLDDVCAGAEGKVNFGFVSKYKKGASVPTGNTKFNFKAGGLNFHSGAYDWLVVNQGGDNAQYKGSGAINGDLAPNGDVYRFMIWAKDLDPDGNDTFRIKIWYEVDDGEIVVYDNGFDQAIGSGNIKIHTGKD